MGSWRQRLFWLFLGPAPKAGSRRRPPECPPSPLRHRASPSGTNSSLVDSAGPGDGSQPAEAVRATPFGCHVRTLAALVLAVGPKAVRRGGAADGGATRSGRGGTGAGTPTAWTPWRSRLSRRRRPCGRARVGTGRSNRADGEQCRDKPPLHVDGKVLSVAVGKSGQVLGQRRAVPPSFAERLLVEMPFLAGMVTFHENHQAAGRRLEGALEDGVTMLEPPRPPAPPPVDEAAMPKTCAAIEVLVRQGGLRNSRRDGDPLAAQRGVLVAVGGLDWSCTRTARNCHVSKPRAGRIVGRRQPPVSATAERRAAAACSTWRPRCGSHAIQPQDGDAVAVLRARPP